MRKVLIAVLATVVGVVALPSNRSTADDRKKMNARTEPELLGTWKLVQAKYGGKEAEFPQGHVEYKHVTPAQYMLVSIDKDSNIVAAWGGHYAVEGEKYEETAEYGMSEIFTNMKGQPHTFAWRVVGNKWYHSGTLAGGFTIEEVWERVERK